ncbi:MAG: nucleotidyl transferase AbiEii/AbiGii toxin family protein [Candidatus Kerfeldbacteria bacterium]|nr:nucleotidyl transferase AbiEii/AbiGii toxin family protein [Candidatus Kerfeldbacteria bacterium]
MLAFPQLVAYYSQQSLPARSILVEYLQHELLDSLYKQPGSEHLSFMGGTALRIVYGGNRFSEDLDFDNFGLSFVDFKQVTSAILKDMTLKGFALEFRFVEKGAYHCYIKFPEILQQHGMARHAKEKILVRIDTVQKERIFKPRVHTLNAFDIYRDIVVNPLDILLSQKLLAVLERKRARGRDFYDVSFLYGLTQPNQTYLEAITGQSMQAIQIAILERCAKLNFTTLARDVEPFLIKPDQVQRVKSFQQFIHQQFSV